MASVQSSVQPFDTPRPADFRLAPVSPSTPVGGSRSATASIEYRVVWSLVFAASLVAGLVVRLVIRPVAALARLMVGGDLPSASTRLDATLWSEARAAADAAAPFVFQVS